MPSILSTLRLKKFKLTKCSTKLSAIKTDYDKYNAVDIVDKTIQKVSRGELSFVSRERE
jgi:hypothetical protein